MLYDNQCDLTRVRFQCKCVLKSHFLCFESKTGSHVLKKLKKAYVKLVSIVKGSRNVVYVKYQNRIQSTLCKQICFCSPAPRTTTHLHQLRSSPSVQHSGSLCSSARGMGCATIRQVPADVGAGEK